MALSRDQVILAADSRSGTLKAGRFAGVDDRRCKLVELTPSLLFAASGATKTQGTFPANIYYDSQELARLAAKNFVVDRSWMEPNQTIEQIAAKWAWDVAFQVRRGVETRMYSPIGPTWVTGVFAGLEPNGDVSVAIARLEYREPRPGWMVPPVVIFVSVPVPPKNNTWVEAFGRNEVAEQYYSRRKVTDQTRPEHLRIRTEQLRKPRRFSPEVVKTLVELTFEKDEPEYPDGSKMVGGKIDIAWLKRRGKVGSEEFGFFELCGSSPCRIARRHSSRGVMIKSVRQTRAVQPSHAFGRKSRRLSDKRESALPAPPRV